MAKEENYVDKLISLLEERTRGTQIAIYSIAGAGLAFAIHKVRPVSKFSRATDIPRHFLEQKEPLKGRIVGAKTSKDNVTLLLDHRPLIRIPVWHSGKKPLPVQIWGVKPIGNHTMTWLQNVANGCEATVHPVKIVNGELYAQVKLQWPRLVPINKQLQPQKSKKKSKPENKFEIIDVGQRVVQIGMAQVTNEISKKSIDNYIWWMPWINNQNVINLLKDAQNRAISHRAGYWHEIIPPSRLKSWLNILRPKPKSNVIA